MPNKPYVPPTLIGNLKTLFAMPCAIPPSVYIETGLTEVMSLFTTVAMAETEHEVREAIGGSLRHQIQTAAQEASSSAPAFGAGTNKMIFEISSLAGKAFMYLFFASIAEQGLFNWTSALLKMYKCPGTYNQWINSSHQPYGVVAGDGFSNKAFDWMNDSDVNLSGPAFAPGVVVKPGHTGVVLMSAKAKDLNLIPCPLELQLMNIATGEVLASNTGQPDASGGYYHSTIMGKVPNPTAVPMNVGMYGKATAGIPDNEALSDGGFCMCFQYQGIDESPSD